MTSDTDFEKWYDPSRMLKRELLLPCWQAGRAAERASFAEECVRVLDSPETLTAIGDALAANHRPTLLSDAQTCLQAIRRIVRQA